MPIVEALVEIRFQTTVHQSAVFGVIYNALRKEYPNVQKLPILQIPEQLREQDPNFTYKPHYRITDNEFNIQIGPSVVTISSPLEYVGWEVFSNRIFSCFYTIEKLDIIKNVTRLGVRYINFFEVDIFKNVELSLRLVGKEKSNLKNTLIRTEIEDEKFKSTLQIANNVAQTRNNVVYNGSIIDIDAFKIFTSFDFFSDMKTIIDEAHESEKKLFFSLLKEDFLKELNPVYLKWFKKVQIQSIQSLET